MEPRVSIVLPVRNGARYLAESVESVLAQTLRDWELIAVDDGSTDATPEILAQYESRDARIRIVRNDPALRLPGALNRGFGEAVGDLLTWTSDDNCYRPAALECMTEALSRRAAVDVVYADYELMDSTGTPIERKRLPTIDHLGYSNIVGACFLFRRRVWEALGGYAEDLFLAEDYDFWLRAIPNFQFAHLGADHYRYRVHAAALGASRRDEARLATVEALRRNLSRLPRRMRYESLTRLEHLARERGDAGAARAWLQLALWTAPLRTARRLLARRSDG